MNDKKIKTALILYIICVVVILAIGSATHLSVVNILSVIGIAGYWLQKYIRFRHRIENREIIFLSAEFIFVVLSVYFLFPAIEKNWLRISVYVIASLHLAAATLFAAFMFLYKTKKLF